MHSTFSDGKALPDDYVPFALNAGLSEIGFSEHLNLFSDDQFYCMDPQQVNEFLTYIDTLNQATENLIIRKGLEIDFVPGEEKKITGFIDNLDLDYRIGSVHYMGDKSVDLGPEFYQGKNVDRVFQIYFEEVICAVESEIFDIIGHCDLVRIFGHKPTSSPEKLYSKLAETMAKHDVVFEVNTNGRNRPLGDFYPDRRFLHVFSENKVKVCVNSDAHLPHRTGQYFDEAYELLRSAGYTEMASFEKRNRKMNKL